MATQGFRATMPVAHRTPGSAHAPARVGPGRPSIVSMMQYFSGGDLRVIGAVVMLVLYGERAAPFLVMELFPYTVRRFTDHEETTNIVRLRRVVGIRGDARLGPLSFIFSGEGDRFVSAALLFASLEGALIFPNYPDTEGDSGASRPVTPVQSESAASSGEPDPAEASGQTLGELAREHDEPMDPDETIDSDFDAATIDGPWRDCSICMELMSALDTNVFCLQCRHAVICGSCSATPQVAELDGCPNCRAENTFRYLLPPV